MATTAVSEQRYLDKQPHTLHVTSMRLVSHWFTMGHSAKPNALGLATSKANEGMVAKDSGIPDLLHIPM